MMWRLSDLAWRDTTYWLESSEVMLPKDYWVQVSQNKNTKLYNIHFGRGRYPIMSESDKFELLKSWVGLDLIEATIIFNQALNMEPPHHEERLPG
jgi:hypothetical protein